MKSPSKTIRAFCHYCAHSRSDVEVNNCTGYTVLATGKPCIFYKYRMGGKRIPIKIMRKFCIECMGGSKDAVKKCSTTDCLIYHFRLGKNPARAGNGKSVVQMALLRSRRQTVSKKNTYCFESSANVLR